jgi:hypothetical protein
MRRRKVKLHLGSEDPQIDIVEPRNRRICFMGNRLEARPASRVGKLWSIS